MAETPAAKGKWDFSLRVIFFSSFISSKIWEKNSSGGIAGFLMVSHRGVVPVVWGFVQGGVRGPAHGFFITLMCEGSSLCLNYCSHMCLELSRLNETKSVASCTCTCITGLSFPSPTSLWSGTSPLGSSRCIWGAADDSRLVEWTLYRPFSMPFLFSPRDHRNATIITVMICSPPGDCNAPFLSENHAPRRAHTQLPQWQGLLATSSPTENRTDTVVWRLTQLIGENESASLSPASRQAWAQAR